MTGRHLTEKKRELASIVTFRTEKSIRNFRYKCVAAAVQFTSNNNTRKQITLNWPN